MINKKRISLNVFFSILQILVTGLVYYFLYKYMLQQVGADQMGVWAIVLSVSSTANIANLGIGASVVRYTATYHAKKEPHNISRLLHTSALFLSAVFFLIILIIYLIAPYWLHTVISSQYYKTALQLVPFSLSCLFLNAVGGVFLSCLDGLQKNYLRSILYITSFAVLIGMSYLYVPAHGLIGVAYAQLWQAGFLLLSSLVSLKLVFPDFKMLEFGWDKLIFKKIFSFGIQEQIISICQLFFDPFTKSVLGNLGSLSMVTYYEMANRFIIQLRGLLVSANQVFVPVFSSTHETAPDKTRKLYKDVFTLNFILSVFWASFIIASVIPVCKIWIGSISREFVVIAVILCIAYWFNIIMTVAYFANMGSARLTPNVLGNIIIGILSVLLSLSLGYLFSGYGVVAGWGIALAAGSFYILYNYHKRYLIYWKDLFVKADLVVIAASLVYMVICFLLFYRMPHLSVWVMFATDFLLFAGTGLLLLFKHPAGKKFISVLKKNS